MKFKVILKSGTIVDIEAKYVYYPKSDEFVLFSDIEDNIEKHETGKDFNFDLIKAFFIAKEIAGVICSK